MELPNGVEPRPNFPVSVFSAALGISAISALKSSSTKPTNLLQTGSEI